MTIRFDEKGKFFTDVVKKEAIQVIIQTPTNIIRGKIHVLPGDRIKDEINRMDDFFALTEATVYNLDSKELYRGKFLAMNRERIIWILPESELEQSSIGGKA
jgi:Family of unknown function (DUF6812)